jgi:2-methylcitrate dehydratase PrpD
MERQENITRQLANFAAGLRYEDIPEEVVQKAKDCILDQLGVELNRVHFGM